MSWVQLGCAAMDGGGGEGESRNGRRKSTGGERNADEKQGEKEWWGLE